MFELISHHQPKIKLWPNTRDWPFEPGPDYNNLHVM